MKTPNRILVVTIFAAVLFSLMIVGNALGAQWEWSHPYPTGVDIRSAWMSTGGDVYAVGDGGTILYFDGNIWSPMNSGTTNILYGVWGASKTDVYVVGDSGTILHFNGTSWSPMNSGTSQSLRGVWGTNGNNVLVVGGGNTVLRYNGNINGDWSPENVPATSAAFYSVWGSDANNIFVVGSGGTIIQYNGAGWSAPMVSNNTQTLYGVWGADADNVFAVGGSGTIVRYSSALQEWLSMNTPTTQWLYGIYGFNVNDVAAVGGNGTILFYDGTGNDWVETTTPTTEILMCMTGNLGLNPTRIVGQNGTIMKFTGSWEMESISLTQASLQDVWGVSENEVFVVGEEETILFFDGSSWTQQNYLLDGVVLRGVWGNSINNVYAVGDNGKILHYGGVWSEVIDIQTSANLNGVWVSPNGEVFIVGDINPTNDQATILHFDGADVWLPMASGTTNVLNAVWGTSESEVFAVGGNGIILKYDGNNWAPMDTDTITTWLTCIWGSSGSSVYTGGATNIYHYDGNAGNSWTESADVVEYPDDLWGTASNNVYAVGGSDQDVIEHFDGNLWSVQYYPGYHPYGIWGSSASNIFAVGDLGMILRYGEQHRPNKPTLVGPSNEAVFPENSYITIESSAFSDPDPTSTHQSTSWKVIRHDTGEIMLDIPDSSDLTEHLIETMYDYLAPGLRYVWQVQHKDNTGLLSPWSDEFAFKIGTSEPDTLETIQAGKSLGDFGMVSIVHWPDNPDPEAVFNIKYDPDNYRIGTWDPEQNKYIEADKGLIIEPGRAYWILTRDPLVVHFTGVPVSKVSDIEVCLHTEASARTGWNMIAPPNKANYLWNKVLVGHPDVDPPVPVTNAIASTLINHRIYEWQGGKYIDHKLDEDFVLEVYKGYWVKALVQDAYLVFPESAQVAGLSTPGNTMLAWKGKAVRWMKRLLPAPREAMADNDLPPVPMETFDGSTNPLFEGCFVQTLR